jgi:kynurenine formamidase
VESFKEIGKRLSNWGRWGDDDERGTLNLIRPEHVVAAAQCVRSGQVFELSIPLGSSGPQMGGGWRINPVHLMTLVPADMETPDKVRFSDDYLFLPLQSATQWDSLAHVSYDDHLYNGFPASSVTAIAGATRNSIDHTMPGMVGRGVLLDIARLVGRDWLEVDHVIEPKELEEAERRQGVRVGEGDALLFRTGWRKKAIVEGWVGWLDANPGLSSSCAEWLHERGVASIISDNWAIEVQPSRDEGATLPLHCILIRDLGMMFGELFDLEELAEHCAADGQWDFLLSAPPLRVTGAVGSPVSPIAIK